MPNSPFDELEATPSSEPLSPDSPQRGWMPPPTGSHWVEESAPLPPLRLHHLFALTAVVAVMLGINGPQQAISMDAEMPFPRWVQTLMVGGGIIYTILAAAGVTSVAYGIAWRRQGVRFFHQPGHWLLVDIGIFAVISSLMQLVVRIVWPRFDGGDVSSSMSLIWIINGISAVGGIAHIGFNIYISLKKCHERRWKWAFAVKAIAVVVRVVGDLVLMLLLLRAARVDRASKTPRDAMHWFGMWLQLAVSGFMVVFLILVVVFTIFTIRQFS